MNRIEEYDSKDGPWDFNINIIWVLVRNAKPQAPHASRTWRMCPDIFNRPFG